MSKSHTDLSYVYVYVISHVNDHGCPIPPVKVGVATDCKSRLGTLQTGNPRQLSIVGQFACINRASALGLESAFHTVHAKKRLTGEWFDIDVLTALGKMCANIRAFLRHVCELDGDQMTKALEFTGVIECESILDEIEAHRGPLQ